MTARVLQWLVARAHLLASTCRCCVRGRGSHCAVCVCDGAISMCRDAEVEIRESLARNLDRMRNEDVILLIMVASPGREWPANAFAVGKTAQARSNVLKKLVKRGQVVARRTEHGEVLYSLAPTPTPNKKEKQ